MYVLRLVVIVLAAACSFAVGQAVVTTADILNEIDYYKILDLQGQTFYVVDGAVEVTISAEVFRTQGIAVYQPFGCSVYDAGLGLCSRTSWTEWVFSSKGRSYAFAVPPNPEVKYQGIAQFHNGNVSRGALKETQAEAIAAQFSLSWFTPSNSVTWVIDWPERWDCAEFQGVSTCGVGSVVGWHNHVMQAVRYGLAEAQPTLAELQADWGVFLSGNFEDGGFGTWDPVEPPEGGGGGPGFGDAPDDEVTRCSILDIPCNFRKLFIPEKTLVDRAGEVWAEMSTRAPLGYVTWVDGLDEMLDVGGIDGVSTDGSASPNGLGCHILSLSIEKPDIWAAGGSPPWEFRLCDMPIYEAYRDDWRDIVGIGFIVVISISAIRLASS